jgi:DNA-binding CsgD family transcriptional regulator
MQSLQPFGRWPLVGRDEALALLEHALEGGAGGVVIAGEAGVGKSRLAAEFVERVGGRPIVRVAASASLRTVPLGAFAAVVPPGLSRTPRQTGEALRLVADHLVAHAPAAPLVWIDDVQLLDELSAALVRELAASRRAFVLATLRTDASCPDAITRLWREAHAQRLEMQPLGPEDTGALLARVLGGPVDGGTLRRIANASRGNLLYLRELVRVGVQSGALARRGELWIWDGPLRVSAELRELIAERLGALEPAALAALETVAFAEPVAPAVAAALGLAPVLPALEDAGLVARDAGDPAAPLRLAHPLFGEVLRGSATPLRAAEIERAHAAALAATGADLLRLAIAQAAGHVAPDPALLLEGMMRARMLADHALATRLARAALAAGGGARAVIELAQCLFWEQRHADVLALLEQPLPADADAGAQLRAALHRASSLYWGFGRDAAAIDVLRAAVVAAPDHPFAGELAGQCAFVLANAARPDEAIAAARAILDDPASTPRARLYATSALTFALAIAGRLDETFGEAVRGLPLARELAEEMPATGGGIVAGVCVACFLAGRFAQAEQVVGGLYRRSAELGDPFLGFWAHLLARNELLRGRLAEAERRALEAVALLRLHDPGLVLPWALAVLAQVAAQRGDAARLRETIRELDANPCRMAASEPEIEAALAWAEAAAGDLVAARRRLAAAVRAEQARGMHGLAAPLLQTLARLGGAGEAAEAWDALDARVGGPLVAAWGRAVRAQAAGDAAALEAAGEALAALDATLDAAESFARAAALHAGTGRRDAARRAAARAHSFASACGDPRTPALAALRAGDRAALTARELHIARLAAAGATRRVIADELGLSASTVGNHLTRIYAKLGVTDRAALAARLEESAG